MKNKLALYISVFITGIFLLCVFSCKKDAGRSGSVSDFSGSFVERGRPVPELSDYRIVYYEPAASGEGGASYANIQESDAPFVITDYGPMDELPAEIKKPAIYVAFSQPVVPLAKLGDPIRESAELFTVEPPLAGTYRWYGTKLLSFEPDAESLPQQRFTVTVSDRIKSLGGKTLQGERSFSFETARLHVLEWSLGEGDRWIWNQNVHPEDAKLIRLTFSYPVNLSEIAKWIEVWSEGKAWPFTLSRPTVIDDKRYKAEQYALVTINETLPLDADVVIELKQGARSEPGWLGTKDSESWNYHTLLPFRFDNASARSYSSPRTKEGDSIPIYLNFNQDVEPEGAERFFSVEGQRTLSKENVHVYGSMVVINNLPLEYQETYYVRISPSLKDLYGRLLDDAERVKVEVGRGNSYVYINNQGSQMLEAGFPAKIVWETQNPVSIRSGIAAASSPYEILSPENLSSVDVSKIPANSKRYFMEDLSPFLNTAGKGSAAMRWDYQYNSSWEDRTYSGNSWLTVQVTNIGITVRYAYNMILVWASHLSDGSAAANADVELLDGTHVILSKKTDAQGLAVFEFRNGDLTSRFSQPQEIYDRNENTNKGLRVRVSEGSGNTKDQAEFIPNDSHNLWRFGVYNTANPFAKEQETSVVFLYTDRGLYRPGETVTFRVIDRSQRRGIYEAYRGPYHVEVGAYGYQAPVFATLDGTSNANGGAFGSFTIPEKLDPGQYQIMYRRGAATVAAGEFIPQTSVSFTVANFERLRFESSLRFPDMAHYQGDKLGASLSASYLSGGGLSGAPYSWYMTRESAWFSPAAGGSSLWRNWRFGPEYGDGRSYIGNGEGSLGPDGKAEISGEASADGVEGAPYSYCIEASVQDAARQEIAANGSVLVHPASYYIAARIDPGTIRNAGNAGGGGTGRVPAFDASIPSAYFLSADKPATLSWALVSPEGDAWNPATLAATRDLSIKLIYHEWKQAKQAGVGGRINLVWERVEETVEERSVKLEANTGRNAASFISGVFNFTPAKSGLWEIRIRGQDQKERVAATSFRFYVSGAGWIRWGSDDVDAISLTTDKDSYSPGETAKVLVRSPLEKGKYLLTLEREGIISQKIIELNGSALSIDIPIEESYLPIVYAAISSYTVRSGPPQNTYFDPDLDKPKGIFGITPINVSIESRSYQIEIENSKTVYRPAEEVETRIKVSLNGKPAPNTEVSFMVVDRGVVDLINYHVSDPASFFYSPSNFPLGVRGADSRSLLIDPVTYSLSDLQGGDNGNDYGKGDDEGAGSTQMSPEERKDFRPTAYFEPFLITGADGVVSVKFRLPDSLTTYRCTAVAVGTRDFGVKEQDLKVSAPLTAVAALPRKLRWRDTGSVSLILTNLENKTVDAKVSLAAAVAAGTNSLWDTVIEIDGANNKTVKILPGTSSEVSFRVAAVGVGEAELAFTLNSPSVNEKIIKTLLVDRPVLTETVTTIGNLSGEDAFIEEGMILPSLVPEGTGSVAVSVSASRLAALKEAVLYLLDYPYGCLEQKTARLLPIVAFGEYLDAFELDSPLKKGGSWNAQKLIEDELEAMAQLQLGDGSFPYWPGGSRGDVFVSLRVAHIAALVKAKGLKVPEALNTRRLLSYITTVSGNTVHSAYKDSFLKGYSLWIRAMYGERISAEITAFLGRGDEAGVSGWAFAGLAALELGQRDMAATARDRVRRFIRPGTRSLDLADTYAQQGYWGYDTDRYALALMLYHSLSPSDDMTTRLASSLIERQRRGTWGNTVSSFWAVLALGAVTDSESAEWKAATSPMQAGVSLGGVSLINTEFKTYGGVPVSYNGVFSEQPLAALARDTLLPLRVERGGAGRLFYTASLRYGIPAELASARDEGLGVFVETFDTDGNPVKNGRLAAGKTYTRKVHLSSSRDRTFVALRAPVPSGAEIIDSTFVTSSTVPIKEDDEETYEYDRSPPLRFIMDDEVRYHWDFLSAGRQEITFRFRAVMPGVYPTPGTWAECMYEEEIFGRSSGELVRIE